MRKTIVESVKAFISPNFISILNTMVNVYTKKGSAYIMHTFIFNEMTRLQYNLLIGCLTIWHNNRKVTDVYFHRYGNRKALLMEIEVKRKFPRSFPIALKLFILKVQFTELKISI